MDRIVDDLQTKLRNCRFYADPVGGIGRYVESAGIHAPDPEFVPPDHDEVSVEGPRNSAWRRRPFERSSR
jgi:hypothetical protein